MRISKDKIVSIVFILLSVAILVLTQQVRVLPNLAEPGPRLFPQIAAIGMILCGIGMFFTKDPEAKEETVYLTRDLHRFFDFHSNCDAGIYRGTEKRETCF